MECCCLFSRSTFQSFRYDPHHSPWLDIRHYNSDIFHSQSRCSLSMDTLSRSIVFLQKQCSIQAPSYGRMPLTKVLNMKKNNNNNNNNTMFNFVDLCGCMCVCVVFFFIIIIWSLRERFYELVVDANRRPWPKVSISHARPSTCIFKKNGSLGNFETPTVQIPNQWIVFVGKVVLKVIYSGKCCSRN